ncbi:MAG TPA: hypothetical protein VIY48_04375 [Candidatus Paceibacterota bacterium]
MTTIEKIPASYVANAQAVLANAKSPKAKRQEALGVLKRAGVAAQPSTVSGVLQNALDKEDKRKAELSKAVKGLKVKTLAEERAEANAAVEAVDAANAKPDLTIGEAMAEAADKGLLTEFVQAITGTTPVGDLPVTEDELKAALAIVARATKQQAEAIRKAAAERKKVAPEGEKVKKVKELTPAQKEKLEKAEKAAETYLIAASAAIGFVGAGLGESKKMQVALGLLSLPALRWLAKRYELKIPSDKKSALLIREFLRVELLTYKPKTEA